MFSIDPPISKMLPLLTIIYRADKGYSDEKRC
jgi:hypothetical protein